MLIIELEMIKVKDRTLIYRVLTQQLFQLRNFRSRDRSNDLACMEDILCKLTRK